MKTKMKWIWLGISAVVCILLIPYSLPILFAGATALLLEGFVKLLMGKINLNRLQAVIVVVFAYIAIICGIVYYLIVFLSGQAIELSQKVPGLVSKDFYQNVIVPLIQRWEDYSRNLPPNIHSSVIGILNKAGGSAFTLAEGFATGVINVFSSVPMFLLKFLIYLVAVFFFCLEFPRLKKAVESRLTDQTKERIHIVWEELKNALVGFIKTQVILSVMTFFLILITFLIIDAPHPYLLSLLVVIVDILPVLGSGSVLVPWGIVSILLNNTHDGIILIIAFVVITVIRRLIEPKLLSTNLGISPLAALASLYIGFELIGIVGIFIGPALVIIFNTLIQTNIIKWNWKI